MVNQSAGDYCLGTSPSAIVVEKPNRAVHDGMNTTGREYACNPHKRAQQSPPTIYSARAVMQWDYHSSYDWRILRFQNICEILTIIT